MLRRWRLPDDVEPWWRVCADPDVMRWIGDGSTSTVDQARQAIEAYEAGWEGSGFGLFAAERRDTGELTGFVGLAVPTFLPEVLPAVEIGWRLGRPHWGAGLATEGARAVLAWAFDDVGLDRLVSIHQVGNDASARVMAKLGMHLERETVHPTLGRRLHVWAVER